MFSAQDNDWRDSPLCFLCCPRWKNLVGQPPVSWAIIGTTVFILTGLLWPASFRTRPSAYRCNCSSNLRQIGLGLEQYSSLSYYGCMPVRANNPRYSTDVVAALYANGQGLIGDLKAFECPSASHQYTQPGGLPNDYIFFPGLVNAPANSTIIAADRPGNHADGACLLYKDVHVTFCHYPNHDVNLYAKWARAFEGGDLQAAALGPEAWARTKSLIQ